MLLCRALRTVRTEPSQREERDIGYALRREVNDEYIIVPVCEIVEVRHADYLCNLLSLSQLFGGDVAHTQMTDQSLTSVRTRRSSARRPSQFTGIASELFSLGRGLHIPNRIAVLIEGDQPVLTDL
jgi:hypothetical protein